MTAINDIYHDLRKIQPKTARKLVREVIKKKHGNIPKTAKILHITRNTIRRTRDGSFEDISQMPNNTYSRTPFETLIFNIVFMIL